MNGQATYEHVLAGSEEHEDGTLRMSLLTASPWPAPPALEVRDRTQGKVPADLTQQGTYTVNENAAWLANFAICR